MRVWIIVVLSFVSAAITTTWAALPWLPLARPAEIPASLLTHWGGLAVIALAGYGLAAVLATAAALLADMARLRRRLVRIAQQSDAGEPDLAAAFGSSLLRPLATHIDPGPHDPLARDATAATANIVRPAELRGEIARLYYIWLVDSQFCTALGLLAVLALLRTVQHFRPDLALPGDIPILLIVIVIGGLVLLAGAGRLAVDSATEQIVQATAQIPWERPESRLVRRIADLLQIIQTDIAAQSRKTARPASGELPDQLARVLDRSRRSWGEAAAGLSSAADALRTTTASMENTIQSALARVSAAGSGDDGGQGFVELQGAVERLTAALEQFSRLVTTPGDETRLIEALRRRGSGQLFDELAKLLRDIDAER